MKLGTRHRTRSQAERHAEVAESPSALTPPKGLGPRRRRPVLIVVSVLLVVVCATGGAAAFARGDDTDPVLALTKPVSAGDTIDADDLREVRWTPTTGVSAVSVTERSKVVGKRAASDLWPGTLVTLEQVTDGPVLQPGQVTVGVSLGPEQMPVRALTSGQRIALVSTPPKGGDAAVTPPQIEATVVAVGRRDDRSNRTVIEVAVSAADGGLLAARAYTERLAVVVRQSGAGR